jgi:PAS domain S-box-containing protein
MRALPQFYVNVPALRPGTPGSIALALVSVAVALALRLVVDPYVIAVPFLTFWPAVIITAVISGVGAGLLCVVLSAAAASFFVIRPHLSFYIEHRADVADLLLFLALACFSVVVITQLRDAIERERAERALRESKERLQLALDTARLGWWQYDPRRRAGSGDARFEEILDVLDGEMPIEELKDRVHPEDAERFWRDHLAQLDPTGPLRSTEEYRVRRRDGEVRWVRMCWLAYLEDAGGEQRVASIVGTVQDISEHKECAARERLFAEREHLLARESAHRAKNLISVVGAIAHQTATKNPEHFVERFSDRMEALSANQDLLVRNEWKGVEVESLVHAQLAHFADLIGRRISADGPRLRVTADAAQAIGLALHELATNAGKYGALSTDSGRVDIRWGAGGETFTMSWTEREGPTVPAPQRRGFGTTVMKAMAERSVGGKVDLQYAHSGVTWRLTCPAANALEAPAACAGTA